MPRSASDKHEIIAAILTGGVTFAVYWFTLAPSVMFIDAGELAAAAHTLGIPHPTGYPLFVMLAWLWQLMPIGTVIYRLNLFSAVCSGISVAFFVRFLSAMLGRMQASRLNTQSDTDDHTSEPPAQSALPLRQIVSVVGGLILGFGGTFWSGAVSIEVYSLHALFLSLLLWLFVTALDAGPEARPGGARWLMFAFVLGLSFTNHGTTVTLAPAFLTLFFLTYGFGGRAWKRIAIAIPPFLVGLLPFLYIPLRAAAHPPLNWGNISNAGEFFAHISGKLYRIWMFTGLEVPSIQLRLFAQRLPFEFGFLLLIPALAGIVISFRRHRRIAWFLLLLFLGCVAYAVNYAIFDIASYFLLAYFAVAVWAAIGLSAFLQWLQPRRIAYGLLLVILALGAQFTVSFLDASARGNYLVEDYMRNCFRTMDQRAIVFSNQWNMFVAASMYYQQVEAFRTDVTVIDTHLLRRRWFIEQLRRSDPELFRGSEQALAAYLDEFAKYERGEPYDFSVIKARNLELIRSIIRAHTGRRPVYFTYGVDKRDYEEFTLVPQGLVFRAYRPGEEPSLDVPVDDRLPFRPCRMRDDYSRSIEDFYFRMNAERGYYLYGQGRKDAAEIYFARAATFRQYVPGARWTQWRGLSHLFYNKL
jgi:hypothetical protein